MTARLNDQDWEMLSAYMDGQLSPSDKSHIDQRLQSKPELATAYNSLIKTRAILKEIPRVKRRRNFFLTSGMVRQLGWLRLIPTLNFGSAAAAILAVLLFILDVFPQAPVMNRAIAPQEAAPVVQDSAARPAVAAEVPGKPEVYLTHVPEVTTEQGLGGGLVQNQGSPQAIPPPEAERLSLVPSEEVAGAPALPPAESPQILTVPLQPDQGPTELLAPSMKVAPAEALAEPSAAQDGLAPQGKILPSSTEIAKTTLQPESLKMEKAVAPMTEPVIEITIEPTELAAENIIIPSPARQMTTATQEPEITEIPAEGFSAKTVAPVTSRGVALVTPTLESIQPVEKVETLPISRAETLLKAGWITLLAISGTLTLLSAILKKKSLS